MNEYLVRSADLKEIVKAKDIESAVRKAIKVGNPRNLGAIVQVDQLSTDVTSYAAIDRFVKIQK